MIIYYINNKIQIDYIIISRFNTNYIEYLIIIDIKFKFQYSIGKDLGFT